MASLGAPALRRLGRLSCPESSIQVADSDVTTKGGLPMGARSPLKIYVASSWRNPHQPSVVAALRDVGHRVYDFRHPGEGEVGFEWSRIDADWRKWTPQQYREALRDPVAQHGFRLDMTALSEADATVLVLPCGRSAHLELGFAVASGQRTFVLCDTTLDEPELMYLMNTGICLDVRELIQALGPPALADTGT